MPAHAATWARRQAFGIRLDKPGIEDHHFVCAGYYNCTETGFGDVVRPRHHVWAVTKYEYDKGIRSDCRAPAYEPMLATHIECSADGLSIFVFGRVLLNWPRLKLYQGAQKLPKIMQRDSRLFVYSDWEVAATADTVEGFVGVRIGPPSTPPDLVGCCGETIGSIGYAPVSKPPHPPPPSAH